MCAGFLCITWRLEQQGKMYLIHRFSCLLPAECEKMNHSEGFHLALSTSNLCKMKFRILISWIVFQCITIILFVVFTLLYPLSAYIAFNTMEPTLWWEKLIHYFSIFIGFLFVQLCQSGTLWLLSIFYMHAFYMFLRLSQFRVKMEMFLWSLARPNADFNQSKSKSDVAFQLNSLCWVICGNSLNQIFWIN